MNIEIIETNNHNELVDFYITRGIEFNEDKEYYNPPLFSYVAKVDDSFVGAITVCKEKGEYILDEVAVVKEREKQGIGTALVKATIEHIKNENGKKIYLVAKNPLVFTSIGFKIIKREEAPSFSECFTCEDYMKTCFPEVMLLEL